MFNWMVREWTKVASCVPVMLEHAKSLKFKL